MIFAIDVDWSSLLEAAYISAALGIGVILVAGVAVVASLQAQDRQKGHQGGAVAFHVLTGVCVLAIVAAVILGISVMVQK